MDSYAINLLKWFEGLSNYYNREFLSKINFEYLKQDRELALKYFIYFWGYERSGTPYGYKAAAVKTIGRTKKDIDSVLYYNRIFSGKKNEKMNPGVDWELYELNIPHIINSIENCKLKEAFDCLKVRGIGHKIKTLFIRDIISLANIEHKISKDLKQYICAFPIDIWLEKVSAFIKVDIDPPKIKVSEYGISRKLVNQICGFIKLAFENAISPIKINQGAWFFSSRVVADTTRLEYLLGQNNINTLGEELNVMKDVFLF